MKDYLIRGLGFNDEIRFFACKTTNIVEEIRKRHDAYPTSIAAVGRCISICSMLGAMLKSDDTVDIRVRGNGPIGQILATSNEHGEIRGYATNMKLHLPSNNKGKLDVKGVVGESGDIIIIKDLGLNEKYTTTSPIVSGEIAEDFTYYFAKSEQIPSAVSLGVLVDTDNSILASGGFILQVMPNTSEDTLTKLEEIIKKIKPISTLINEGLSLEYIIKIIFEDNYKILKKTTLKFKCTCSKEKYKKALITLGKKELLQIAKNETTETICAFCNEKYYFKKEEIKKLIENL